jgi:hypothetical protein
MHKIEYFGNNFYSGVICPPPSFAKSQKAFQENVFYSKSQYFTALTIF